MMKNLKNSGIHFFHRQKIFPQKAQKIGEVVTFACCFNSVAAANFSSVSLFSSIWSQNIIKAFFNTLAFIYVHLCVLWFAMRFFALIHFNRVINFRLLGNRTATAGCNISNEWFFAEFPLFLLMMERYELFAGYL